MALPVTSIAAGRPEMATSALHPSAEMWIGLSALVLVLLAADLMVLGRGQRKVGLGTAAIWSAVWLALALAFGIALWALRGGEPGSEYFAGYLLERSLSLDNIFVFTVIFGYFAVPIAVQPRVLAFGIGLALILRLVFILIGAALLASFHATFYAFGALLLYTAYKLVRHDSTEIEPEHNPALRILRRYVPITATYRHHRLTVREGGKRLVTPLAAVLVVIATTDIVFAVDSIPAIFAVTQEPFVVFSANAFALLGLRALYFLVVGIMDRLVYLSEGLAVILALVGAKMLSVDLWKPPIWLSLVSIAGVLAFTAVLSARASRRPQTFAAPGDGVDKWAQRVSAPSYVSRAGSDSS